MDRISLPEWLVWILCIAGFVFGYLLGYAEGTLNSKTYVVRQVKVVNEKGGDLPNCINNYSVKEELTLK